MREFSISVYFARAVLRNAVKAGIDPVALLRRNRISPRLLLEDDANLVKALANGRRRVAVHAEDEPRLRERYELAVEAATPSGRPLAAEASERVMTLRRLVHVGDAMADLALTPLSETKSMRFSPAARSSCNSIWPSFSTTTVSTVWPLILILNLSSYLLMQLLS